MPSLSCRDFCSAPSCPSPAAAGERADSAIAPPACAAASKWTCPAPPWRCCLRSAQWALSANLEALESTPHVDAIVQTPANVRLTWLVCVRLRHRPQGAAARLFRCSWGNAPLMRPRDCRQQVDRPPKVQPQAAGAVCAADVGNERRSTAVWQDRRQERAARRQQHAQYRKSQMESCCRTLSWCSST